MIRFRNVKFCDTFPSLCLVLDGLKFAGNCNNTNGQSLFKCKDITHQVKFPVAPEIKEVKLSLEPLHITSILSP